MTSVKTERKPLTDSQAAVVLEFINEISCIDPYDTSELAETVVQRCGKEIAYRYKEHVNRYDDCSCDIVVHMSQLFIDLAEHYHLNINEILDVYPQGQYFLKMINEKAKMRIDAHAQLVKAYKHYEERNNGHDYDNIV